MAITYTVDTEDDLLVVRAAGFDENLEEVQAYGVAVITAAVEHDSARVLCLESDLEYRLGTVDTFRAASYVAERAPRVARVALVVAPQYLGDARFWEDVTRNRGLQAAVFGTEDEARRWLDAGQDASPPRR
jgi:hypothetical protein